jgi:hypothetical protein
MKVPDARTALISISINNFSLHYPVVEGIIHIDFKDYYILSTGQTEIIHPIQSDFNQFIQNILNLEPIRPSSCSY